MADLIKSNIYQNEFSENLISKKSLFIDSPTISYSGNGSLTIVDNNAFAKDSKSAYLFTTYNPGTGLNEVFSFGDALNCVTKKAGKYFFSFKIMNEDGSFDTDQISSIGVDVFIDGNPEFSFENEFYFNEFELNEFVSFNCSFNVIENKTISFAIKVFGDYPGSGVTPIKLYFSGFKCELDNRKLNIPTPYSYPLILPQEDIVGWAYYADSLATPTISIGTSYTQITIDKLGASTTELYLPREIRGIASLFTANKITPISIGDDFDGRFDCTITARTGSPTAIEFIIDISGGVAGTNKAFTGWIQAIGTAPYDQSMPLDYFTLSTFLTNGGTLYARVDTGTVTIGRRNIKISRKSKNQ